MIVTAGLIYTYKTGDLQLNLVGTIIMIVISLLILSVEWEDAQNVIKRNKFCGFDKIS